MKVLVLADLVAHDLQRSVADHLVGVHVGRRSRPALDDVDDELVRELSLSNLLACRLDCLRLRGGEQSEIGVGPRGGLFHRRERRDQMVVPSDGGTRDREILHRAGGVYSPIYLRRNLFRAEQVVFYPGAHGSGFIGGLAMTGNSPV